LTFNLSAVKPQRNDFLKGSARPQGPAFLMPYDPAAAAYKQCPMRKTSFSDIIAA